MSVSAANRGEVNAAYQAELGRPAEESSLEAWDAALQQGRTTLAQLDATLGQSKESQNAISVTFEDDLGRAANSDDLAAWGSAFAAGTQTLPSLRGYLATTAESHAAISQAFEGTLSRPASAADLGDWGGAFAAGTQTLASLRTFESTSPTAATAIYEVYRSVLARDPTADEFAAQQGSLAGGATLGDAMAMLRSNLAWSPEAADALQAMTLGDTGQRGSNDQIIALQRTMATDATWTGSLAGARATIAWSSGTAKALQVIDRADSGSVNDVEIASIQQKMATDATWTGSLAGARATIAWSSDTAKALQAVDRADTGVVDNALLAGIQQTMATGTTWTGTLAGAGAAIAWSPDTADALQAAFLAKTGQHGATPQVAYYQAALANDPSRSLTSVTGDIAAWAAGTSNAIQAIYLDCTGQDATAAQIAAAQQTLPADASWTDAMTGLRASVATTQASVDAIQAVSQDELNHPIDAGFVAAVQSALANGSSLDGLRHLLSTSSEAAGDINATFERVSAHDADPAALAQAQAALASGQSLDSVEDYFTARQLTSGDANPTAKAVNGWYGSELGRGVDAAGLASAEAQLAGGATPRGVMDTIAGMATPLINGLYQDVLGRPADPAGLAAAKAGLAAGGTLAQARRNIAASDEATGVIASFYQTAFGRPPSADEVIGMRFALGATVPDNAAFGFAAPDNSNLALTSAANLLAQLPVSVTLCNGATPQLSLPGGITEDFANASQLMACVLGLTMRQGQADAGSLSAYQLTQTWLDKINQPMLQVAANWAALARHDHADAARVTLDMTAYQLALKMAALPPGARSDPNYAMAASVVVNGHKTDVVVYNDASKPLGHVLFHDKPADIIPGIIEQVALVVLDVAAAATGDYGLLALSVSANLAKAGQDFSNGQVLSGLLDVGDALGVGLRGIGSTVAGNLVLATTAAVGGTSSVVANAQQGNPLGVISGVLTIAAAAASLKVSEGDFHIVGDEVTALLAGAATGTAIADAFARGDVSTGLITSLGPLLGAIADSYVGNAQSSTAQDVVDRLSGNQYAQNDEKTDLGQAIKTDVEQPGYYDPSGKYQVEKPLGHPDLNLIEAALLAVGGEIVAGLRAPRIFGALYDVVAYYFTEKPVVPDIYEIPVGTPQGVEPPGPVKFQVVSGQDVTQVGTQVRGKLPNGLEAPNTVLYKADSDGNVTNFQVYAEDGLPAYRVDVVGAAHGGVPTPHVLEWTRNMDRQGIVHANPLGYVTSAHDMDIP